MLARTKTEGEEPWMIEFEGSYTTKKEVEMPLGMVKDLKEY